MKTLPVLVMTLAAFAAHTALGHAELTLTVPADRATVAAAPKNLELRFSEPVRLTALTIQKGEEQKQNIETLPAGNSAEFTVALPATLGEGHYVVAWRALSDDTHVMSGEFMFAVGAAPAADAHAGHGAAPAAESHDAHGAAH
jgi:copper transport protein